MEGGSIVLSIVCVGLEVFFATNFNENSTELEAIVDDVILDEGLEESEIALFKDVVG